MLHSNSNCKLQFQVHAKFLRKSFSKYKVSVDHFMTVAMTRLKDLGVVDKEASDNQGLELAQVRWMELLVAKLL